MRKNGTDGGGEQRRQERDLRDATAELVPASGEFDLLPGRLAHHREQLMNEIHRSASEAYTDSPHQQGAPAASFAAARSAVGTDRPRPGTSGRRRLLRPAVLAPAAALALAGVVVTAVTVTGQEEVPTTRSESRVGQERGPGTSAGAVRVLHDASAAAESLKPVEVPDDSHVYVRSKVREAELGSGRIELGPLRDREFWYAQQPGPVEQLGHIAIDGEVQPLNLDLGDRPQDARPGIDRPTYRWLSQLPTDPNELRTLLYELTPDDAERGRDQAVFEQIRTLTAETLLPPRTAAALYRAAAGVPGVVEVPEAQDALGRKGVGIAREDRRSGTRAEWVFDRDTFAFLGSRTVLTRDLAYGKKGQLLDAHAVLGVGVAAKGGERPADGRYWQQRGGNQRTAES
ncbi:CU044_5270 family protein [Streptomyces sp. XM4193]|uniref:CU044_5270 family protein n=1 Tax=Streptomyces sp. XM4193 TaxID=2929782 RepID=UPI001FFBFC86|nr:CU044_5270 family protein [Streptomyces sp. XM4193]MCK1797045.1 CU044_5270 family protein [Streptomyces sp. XM4193]